MKETGRRFRDTVLAYGGGRAPEKVFHDFRGRGGACFATPVFDGHSLLFRPYTRRSAAPQRADFCLKPLAQTHFALYIVDMLGKISPVSEKSFTFCVCLFCSGTNIFRRPAAHLDSAARVTHSNEFIHVDSSAIRRKHMKDEVRAHYASPKLAEIA